MFLHLGFCFSVEVEPLGGFHAAVLMMIMFSLVKMEDIQAFELMWSKTGGWK